ncbi:hypothetical protein BDW22DRAFT_324598 [Trametopsis cervina]|nr:hypothetical protein BDW22DRAFT_324598 [Trametopsis cervina]
MPKMSYMAYLVGLYNTTKYAIGNRKTAATTSALHHPTYDLRPLDLFLNITSISLLNINCSPTLVLSIYQLFSLSEISRSKCLRMAMSRSLFVPVALLALIFAWGTPLVQANYFKVTAPVAGTQ